MQQPTNLESSVQVYQSGLLSRTTNMHSKHSIAIYRAAHRQDTVKVGVGTMRCSREGASP